jgi:4-hydroxy-tetrahydrodipicolinate reductase
VTIKVGVLGAAGRMGNTVCDAVEGDAELELVVRIDPAGGDGIETSVDALSAAGAEVVVDFTQPKSVMENIRACVAQGVHCVVGTTGFTESDFAELRTLLEGGSANVFIAPNFSIGAVLMMHFSKQAARYLGSVEITEQHHTNKLDAPSGTATKTARDIAEVWKQHGRPPGGEAHPDEHETITGARGADADGIHIHAMRVLGRLAHQEVVFGGPGENLTIRHYTMDRTSFMPGVLRAVKAVSSHPGLTIGLEQLLDLE